MEYIQKKIHYCWYGRQPKNALIEACLASWRKYLPEYEIVEWNEDNSELDCDFAKQASRSGHWAFLSDYIRLKVLAQYGGIYLDTDMLFIKPMDELLKYSCFIGYQANGQIAAGIVGAHPGHPFITSCRDRYKNIVFEEDRLMTMAIPRILTEVYEAYNEKSNVKIFDYTYFYPYLFEDSLKGIDHVPSIKAETIAVHMWNASWFTKKELAGFAFEHKKYIKGVGLMLGYYRENPRHIFALPGIAFRYLFKR